MNNLIDTLKRAFTVPRQLSMLLIVGAIPFTVAEGMLYEAFHDIPQSRLDGIGAATLLVALWKTARGSAGWRTFSWILWWIRVASLTFGAYPIFGSQPEWVPSGMAVFFALFMAFIILCATGYMCLWFRLNKITKPRPFLEAKLAPSSAVEKKPRDAERPPAVGREQHKVVQSLCEYCRSEYFPGEVRCRSCSAPLGSVRANGREHPTVSLDANTSETRLPALDSRTAGPDHHVSSLPKTALIVSGLGVLAVVLVSVLMPPPSRDNRHAATRSPALAPSTPAETVTVHSPSQAWVLGAQTHQILDEFIAASTHGDSQSIYAMFEAGRIWYIPNRTKGEVIARVPGKVTVRYQDLAQDGTGATYKVAIISSADVLNVAQGQE